MHLTPIIFIFFFVGCNQDSGECSVSLVGTIDGKCCSLEELRSAARDEAAVFVVERKSGINY